MSNVRDIRQRRKRDNVRAVVVSRLPLIICLQETKFFEISPFLDSSFLPPNLRSFVFKPSNGASSGILTA
jgi:exonuclease III